MAYRLSLTAALIGILSLPGWAQHSRFEVGLKGGVGSFQTTSGGRGLIGVEMCAWCRGRWTLFGEYSHWPKDLGNTSDRPLKMAGNTAGLGLRIQNLGEWCLNLCFVDLGLAAVNSPGGTGSGGAPVIGAGLWIPIGGSLYIRPQVRGYLRGDDSAQSGEIGIGWRF